MDNPLGGFKDEVEEVVEYSKKKVVNDVAKGILKSAQNQVFGEKKHQEDKTKKVDPTTGKPVPTKKILTQLTQATAQLQQAKIKKLREELDKQRLKITDEKQKLAPIESAKTIGHGPIVQESSEQEKGPPPEAVQATLRNSKSTGEFGRQVGG